MFLLLSRKAPLIHAQNGPSLKHLVLPLNCLQILFLFGSSQHSEEPCASSEEPLLLGAGVVWNLRVLLPRRLPRPPRSTACAPSPGVSSQRPSQRALWVVLVPFSNWGEHGESFRNSASGNRRQHLAMPCPFHGAGGTLRLGSAQPAPGGKTLRVALNPRLLGSLSQRFRPCSASVAVSSCAGFLVGAHLAP